MAKQITTVSTLTAPAAPKRTIAEDLDRVVFQRRPGRPSGRKFVMRAQLGGVDSLTGDLISPKVMSDDHGVRPILGAIDPSDTERKGEVITYEDSAGVMCSVRRDDIPAILYELFIAERDRQEAAELDRQEDPE